MRTKQIDDVAEIARHLFNDYGMDWHDIYFTSGRDARIIIYYEDGIEVDFSQEYGYLDILGLTGEEKTEVQRRIKEMSDGQGREDDERRE